MNLFSSLLASIVGAGWFYITVVVALGCAFVAARAIVETLSVKHIGRVEQRISASRLDPASAKSLRTPAKEPCLLIVRRHFDYKGKLILSAVNQHRAVDYVYAMELKRSK